MNFYSSEQKLASRSPKRRGNWIAIAFWGLIAVPLSFHSAHALDWNDAEWKVCPQQDLTGRWTARSHSQTAPKAIRFDGEQAEFWLPNEKTATVVFTQNAVETETGSYIELVLRNPKLKKQVPNVLRIRPHAVFPAEPESKRTRPVCLIKIFRFSSPKNAERGKYEDWNIYEKADS